ncbi:hypothetical protein GGU10DRAFT_334497 [Lentinula aff. detonsa]|uniref:Uncharacterized protein n=1 Tax=Lentinula aff. detonsa TaxID=2804958 RepID=A0AA38KF92_9AGAR|nr:hypothetical protein GGU10DRAFT_334497 [Lentinula aff. detonsa]
MSVALPAGLYKIQVTSSNPALTLAAPSSAGGNITVNTSSSQVWQVSGDGVLTAFTTFAGQARTNNSPAAQGTNVVANSGSPAQWIITGVKLISNSYWTGYIMTNDGTQLFWNLDGNNNVLVNPSSSKAQFTFTPVSI